ncbi:hypothetical protein FKM82_009382 [Ascaphus truei]
MELRFFLSLYTVFTTINSTRLTCSQHNLNFIRFYITRENDMRRKSSSALWTEKLEIKQSNFLLWNVSMIFGQEPTQCRLP